MNYINIHKQEAVLIISDINMPGMSGLELLKNIKEKYEKPSPVVMMITAYGDENNYRMAMQLGADDFLTKPLDFTSLKVKLSFTCKLIGPASLKHKADEIMVYEVLN